MFFTECFVFSLVVCITLLLVILLLDFIIAVAPEIKGIKNNILIIKRVLDFCIYYI